MLKHDSFRPTVKYMTTPRRSEYYENNTMKTYRYYGHEYYEDEHKTTTIIK